MSGTRKCNKTARAQRKQTIQSPNKIQFQRTRTCNDTVQPSGCVPSPCPLARTQPSPPTRNQKNMAPDTHRQTHTHTHAKQTTNMSTRT